MRITQPHWSLCRYFDQITLQYRRVLFISASALSDHLECGKGCIRKWRERLWFAHNWGQRDRHLWEESGALRDVLRASPRGCRENTFETDVHSATNSPFKGVLSQVPGPSWRSHQRPQNLSEPLRPVAPILAASLDFKMATQCGMLSSPIFGKDGIQREPLNINAIRDTYGPVQHLDNCWIAPILICVCLNHLAVRRNVFFFSWFWPSCNYILRRPCPKELSTGHVLKTSDNVI